MVKLVLCLLGVSLLFGGCLKKQTGCPPVSDAVAPMWEQQIVVDYLATNNITATKDASGMYYQILVQGTGGNPNNCSSIAINYIGQLTNGNIFDQGTNKAFTLGSLIDGWKKGLSLIQKGGHIKLYIPPALGYGSSTIKDDNGVIVIPPNSMLIFDITLLDFQ